MSNLKANSKMKNKNTNKVQSHTTATLDTLKERVEELEKEAHDKYMKEYGSSDAEAFSAGRLEAFSDVLQIIDEVRNE